MKKNSLRVLSFLFFLAPFSVMANTSYNIDELLGQCATHIPKPVAHAIIRTESGYNPHAIGVNFRGKSVGGFKQPKNYNDAVSVATNLISAGKNIDMGFAQINSANLKMLNLSVSQVLEPCSNLKAMQYIFAKCFNSAQGEYPLRIQKAFSCYNTGNHKNGFKNGYVKKAVNNLNIFLSKNRQKNNMNYNIGSASNTASLNKDENNIVNDYDNVENTISSTTGNVDNENTKHQNNFDAFIVNNQKGLF